MNKLYLVIPAVLLLAFGGVYYTHSLDSEKKAVAAKAAADQAAAEAAAKKAEAEKQAREDADRRTAERLAEEKKKEDEKAAKWAAQGKQIADDTAAYLAQAEKNSAELKTLEAQLAALREEKNKATQSNFDLDLDVEKARIAKRSAELEIQRYVEMVARKGGTTLGGASIVPAAP